jgi:NodT family efflux transporter outer membrane factor (OMF) lipoprotein
MTNRNPLKRSLRTVSLLSALAVAGCTVGPDYHPPQVQMPPDWVSPTAAAPAAATQPSVAVVQPSGDITRWWSNFNDPVLESLINRALESNLDLRAAALRLRQAREARRLAASGLWPRIDTSASYRHSGTDIGHPGPDRDSYNAGLDASWEVDVFGGIRRGVEAAGADVRVAEEDRRDVQVLIASEVALNYLDVRSLQRQLEISRENLSSQQRSLQLTRQRFRAGFETGLDTANAESLVASTLSQIPLQEADLRLALYALGVLLGGEPGSLLDELSQAAPIPGTPPQVPVGLPSDLLRRRPDIRRAEAQVHAATARIGVAVADLYPRFLLNGSVGVSGADVSALSNRHNTVWSLGPSVSWPLFDAGRIRANIAIQTLAQEQSVLAYRATILNALQEVENALTAYVAEQQHRKALIDAVTAERRAVELSTQLYRQGETDFLNVLVAQRALYGSEDSLVQSDRRVAQNLVQLYRALGGGWEEEAPQ